MKVVFLCFLLIFSTAHSLNAAKLGSYNINPESISVSGFSAGGFMAVQLHVAYSKLFSGVGVMVAGPYWCAEANLLTGTVACMYSPILINVDYLQRITKNTAATGYADQTENMHNDKVFLFAGTLDSTIKPGVVKATEEYYRDFVKLENIKTEYSIVAEHGFPTVINGGPCDKQNKETYINRCDYDAAFAVLDHIYGDLKKPVYPTNKYLEDNILQFDQTEFFHGSALWSYKGLDDIGYVFVPDSCKGGLKSCRLHVALHGCKQGREFIQNTFVNQTGYNEVATLNDVIILYPQVKKNFFLNPGGCFDWWGYTGLSYASNIGDQMVAIRKMVDRIATPE